MEEKEKKEMDANEKLEQVIGEIALINKYGSGLKRLLNLHKQKSKEANIERYTK